MQERDVILIADPQILVQMDLAQALRDVSVGAEIVSVSSLSCLADQVRARRRITGVVVGTGVPEFIESGLGADLARRGAWVVCLNGRHVEPIRAHGWHPLARPFSTEDAQRLFAHLLVQQGCAAD